MVGGSDWAHPLGSPSPHSKRSQSSCPVGEGPPSGADGEAAGGEEEGLEAGDHEEVDGDEEGPQHIEQAAGTGPRDSCHRLQKLSTAGQIEGNLAGFDN